jgi:hypothetical protein
MSDEDLWRGQEPSEAGSPEDADSPGASEGPRGPEPAGTEATRPSTGGAGPASAPGPSYQPPPGPAAVPPPTNPYAQPYAQPNPYDPRGEQHPYGPAPTTPYPQQGAPGLYADPGYAPPPNPYPAPHEYGAPQNPYGAPYQPAYSGGQLPDHPSATTAMVLGIIGLVGVALCAGLTLVLSPAAWIVGAKAVREIDASPGRYGGRDRAQAGKIMGIIGTVLLVLEVLAVIGIVALAVSGVDSSPSPVYPSPGLRNG